MCILKYYAILNEKGSLTPEEKKKLDDCKKDLNELIDSIKNKKPPPPKELVDALDKIKKDLEDIGEDVKKKVTDDKIEDTKKDLDNEITKVTEQHEEYAEIFEEIRAKKICILEIKAKINAKGIGSLTSEELEKFKQCQDDLKKLIDTIKDKKPPAPPAVLDVIKKIEDGLKDVEDSLKDEDKQKKVEEITKELNDTISNLKKKHPEHADILDQIEAKKKCILDFYAKKLSQGVGALTAADMKMFKQCQEDLKNLVEDLKNKKPPPPQELIDAVDDLVNKVKELDDKDAGKNEKINEIQEKIKCIKTLQDKIMKNGLSSLTNEETERLEKCKEDKKKLIDDLNKDPNVDEETKDQLNKIVDIVDEKDNLIQDKLDVDKILQFIKDLEDNMISLKPLLDENQATTQKVSLDSIIKILDTIANKKIEDVPLITLFQLETQIATSINAIDEVQKKTSSLPLKSLLKKKKKLLQEILQFIEENIFRRKEVYKDSLFDDLKDQTSNPEFKVFALLLLAQQSSLNKINLLLFVILYHRGYKRIMIICINAGCQPKFDENTR